MRILVVAPAVMPIGGERYGGIEKLVYDWSKALANTGNEVTIAAPLGSRIPPNTGLIGTVSLPREQDHDDITESRINPDEFDVIHDYSHHHVLKDENRAIHVIHDPIHQKFDFKSKKNVLCYSNWQKERFEALYHQKALVMPLNFVDTDVFKPDPDAKRERFLFLGKLTPDKGAAIAIAYCKELGYPLDVVGGLIPSDSTAYRDVVERMCRDNGFGFHFNVTESEKLAFLQNAKALIYPQSLDDSHWLTGMEAWACGTPTVCYDHGAMMEVCPVTADVVKSEDQFKKSMKWMAEFPTDKEAKFVREYAEARYSVKAIMGRWLQLYNEVANGKTWA